MFWHIWPRLLFQFYLHMIKNDKMLQYLLWIALKILNEIIIWKSRRDQRPAPWTPQITFVERYFSDCRVRGYWALENELHWCLDIGFREDKNQVPETRSAENLVTLRHIGINLLKQEISCKRGIEGKRKKAGWDENYLFKILNFQCICPNLCPPQTWHRTLRFVV